LEQYKHPCLVNDLQFIDTLLKPEPTEHLAGARR